MERPLYIVGGPKRHRRPGGPEAWGTPMPLLHQSIAAIHEKDLIAHVLGDGHYRRTLLSIKGMPSEDAQVEQQVELRHYRKQQKGEIDILVVPREDPERATAIQVKRFKAVVGTNEQGLDEPHLGHFRRLDELMTKGIDQANETKRVGFAHVYLWIFVAIDSRHRNNGWYTYDGPDAHLRSRIDSAISLSVLDERIGLVQFEWVQPMDRPPFELSTHGGHVRRLATPTPQPSELSEWLRTMRSSRSQEAR